MNPGVRRRCRDWAVVLACVVAVAGWLPVGAEPLDAATRVVGFETRAEDGTVLRGDVHLPAGEDPLAAVLILSPYWNTVKGPGAVQGDSEAVKPFVDAGFAVALVNLRGTGKSDGCFQWGSQLDWSDTSVVVEALAREQWSNGNIGMYGTSYEGWTQYMAMAEHPPALKAVVPISGVIDLWSLLTRRGAPISVGPAASTVFGASTSFADVDPAVVSHVGCAEYERHLQEGNGLLRRGDRTEYYRSRDLRARIAGSPVPALVANGFRYVSEGHTLQFEGLWHELAADRTRFMLGQWGHGGKRADFNQLAVGWFDHYLRGGPQATQPGIVEYQDDAGGWHTAPAWPPPGTPSALYLSGDALTPDRGAVADSSRSFQSLDVDGALDTADNVASEVTGRVGVPPGGPGPVCGPHQLVYLSPPLVEEIRLAGNFSVDLTLSSTLPGGNLVATLYRVSGAGDCTGLLTGAADVERAQLDLRHWLEPGASRPFPVGTPTRVSAESLPLASVLHPGERLALAIGASSAEILPDPLKPRVTVATGAGTPGILSLPVVAGTVRFR